MSVNSIDSKRGTHFWRWQICSIPCFPLDVGQRGREERLERDGKPDAYGRERRTPVPPKKKPTRYMHNIWCKCIQSQVSGFHLCLQLPSVTFITKSDFNWLTQTRPASSWCDLRDTHPWRRFHTNLNTKSDLNRILMGSRDSNPSQHNLNYCLPKSDSPILNKNELGNTKITQ